MTRDSKLIETRGEEPAFLPGHVGEAWRKVDFGLGASTMHSSPEVEASLPPRNRNWGRTLLFSLAATLVTALAALGCWALFTRLFR